MLERPALKLAVFDFDLTLTAHHVYNALSGAQGGHSLSVPPPYARTEKGQLVRLAELDAGSQYKADGGFAMAAIGGARRLEQLHELLRELRDAGVECMVCSRGLVGSVRWCLDQVGLLPFFSEVFGCSGCFYGYTEFDVRLPSSPPEPHLARFLGDASVSGWTSKKDMVDRCLQERGLSCDEAIFVDDSASEVASVALTCAAIQVLTPHGMGKRELALLRGLLAGMQPLHGIVSPSCFGPVAERQRSAPRCTTALNATSASETGSSRQSQPGEGRAADVQPCQSEESSTAVESSTKSVGRMDLYLDEGLLEEKRPGRCARGAWIAEAPDVAQEEVRHGRLAVNPTTLGSLSIQQRSRMCSEATWLTPSSFSLAGGVVRSPAPRSCSPGSAPFVNGKAGNARDSLNSDKHAQVTLTEPALSSSARFCWPRSTSSPRLPSPSPVSAATAVFSCRPGSPPRATVLTSSTGVGTPGRGSSPGRLAILTPAPGQVGPPVATAIPSALPGRPSRAWRRSSPTSASAGRLTRSPTPDVREMRGVLGTPPHSSPSLGTRHCAVAATASHGQLPFRNEKLSVAPAPRHESASSSQPPSRTSISSVRAAAGTPLLHSSGSVGMFTTIALESPGRDALSQPPTSCANRPLNQGPFPSFVATAFRGSSTSRGAQSSSPRPASRTRAPPPIWVKDQLDKGHRMDQGEHATVEALTSEQSGYLAGCHPMAVSRGGWPRALPLRPQRSGAHKISSQQGYSDAGSAADGCTRRVSWGSSTRTPSTPSSSPTQPMLRSPGLRKGSRASTPDVRADFESQQSVGFLGASGQSDAKFSVFAEPPAIKAQRSTGPAARTVHALGSGAGAVPRPIPFMASPEASREIKREAAAYEALQIPCVAA